MVDHIVLLFLLPVFEELDLPKPLLCGRLGPIGSSEIFPRLTHDFISTLDFPNHAGTPFLGTTPMARLSSPFPGESLVD